MSKQVYVAETHVGRGVFANQAFEPGDLIDYIAGEAIGDPEYGSSYCIDLGDGRGFEPGEPFRFLNHSCEPNCELMVWEGVVDSPTAEECVWIEAVRAIRPGEELTIDYGWSIENSIPCSCRAAACRGWIVSVEELPKLLRRLRSQRAP